MVVSLHLGATRVGGLSASAPAKATGEIPARLVRGAPPCGPVGACRRGSEVVLFEVVGHLAQPGPVPFADLLGVVRVPVRLGPEVVEDLSHVAFADQVAERAGHELVEKLLCVHDGLPSVRPSTAGLGSRAVRRAPAARAVTQCGLSPLVDLPGRARMALPHGRGSCWYLYRCVVVKDQV